MGILGKKGKFAQKKERKGLWRGAVTGIAAIVVFCTTYALILPAITMETQGLSCGLAEHTHSQDCYQLICGKQEYFSHSHSDECYENGALVCTLTERTLHHHSEDCYSKPEPICGLTEGQGHTHAESCYTTERTLVCTQSECSPHTHSDGCYTEEAIPCTQEVVEGHTHGEDCYTDGERTCGKEETQGHTHSEACAQTKQVLTCTLAETQGHRHSDECYEEKQLLSCGQDAREAHTHSESCYPSDFQPTLICGQEDIPEHRHSQDCCARICELEEHTHSELCVENHEAFLENQNEILKNGNEQTGSNENSSNEEAQNQGNSQEQASNNETQNQENSQQQASNEEGQNQQNSQEQASNEQTQNQQNSQEQSSNNEAQNQGNSQLQTSNNEAQNQENSGNEPLGDNTAEDVDSTDGNANNVDWNDVEAAIEAGYYPICENYEEEHVHTQECYVPIDEVEGLLGGSLYTSGENGEEGNNGEGSGVMLLTGNASVDLNSVADVTLSSTNVEYNLEKDQYYLTVTTTAVFNTQSNGDGTCCVVNKNGDDCGLNFSFNLGKITIPDNSTVLDQEVIVIEAGRNAAKRTYTKDENGNIILNVQLLQDYVNSSAANGSTGTIRLNTSLGGSLGKDAVTTEGRLIYSTPGNVTLTVESDAIKYPEGTTKDGDVSVSKNGSYISDDNLLIYTVTVSTRYGTPGKIQVEDVMEASGLNISELSYVKVDNVDLTSGQYTYDTTSGSHKLSLELEQITAPWGSKIITYAYKLADAPTDVTLVNNKAKASSQKDTGSPEAIYTTDTVPVNVVPPELNPNLEKSANLWYDWNYSRNQTVIPWKLTVNTNNKNLAGMTLTDTMLANRLNDPAMIVKVNNETVTEYDSHFTIDETTGAITFLGGDNGNTNSYELIYFTDLGTLGDWGNGTISNTATLGGIVKTATLSKDNGSLTKANGIISLDEEGNLSINWVVNVDIAGDGVKSTETLTDYLSGDEPHYYERSSIRLKYGETELVKDTHYTVKFFDSNGNELVDNAANNAVQMQINFKENDIFNVGNQRLLLTYTTTATKPEKSVNYNNQAAYRGKNAYSSAPYTPFTLEKTDGNGKKDISTSNDPAGKLYWKVKAVVGSLTEAQSLIIEDTLPANVSVLSLQVEPHAPSGQWYKTDLTIAEDGSITGSNNEFTFTGSCTKPEGQDHYTVTVHMYSAEEGKTIPGGTQCTLTLNCQIDENYQESLTGPASFNNSATAQVGDVTLSANQTQNWELLKKENLAKNGAWNGDARRLEYSLMINPYGNDLDPDGGLLYITDEFTYYPRPGELDLVYNLVQSSVVLYDASLNENGEWVKGNRTTKSWRWTEDEEIIEGYGNKRVKKILRLEVPDSTPLILEYHYWLASFKEGTTYLNLNAVNNAYLSINPTKGYIIDLVNTGWQVSNVDDDITTGKALNVTKVAEGNNQTVISGVKFQVYPAVQNGSKWEWSTDPVIDESGNVKVYETSAAGTFSIKKESYYDYNVLYKVVETETVDGYVLPDNPPEVRFYFSNAEDTTHTLPASTEEVMSNAKDLSEKSAYAYVTNTPAKAQFSVEKIWKDSQGNTLSSPPLESIELTLKQVATEQQDATLNDPLASKVTVQTTCQGWNDTPTSQTYSVPKGTEFIIVLTKTENGQNPVVETNLPGINYPRNTLTATHVDGTGVYTYSFVATYSVCISIDPRASAGEYSCTITHSGGSSGAASSQVIAVRDLGTITLDASNKWAWSSTDSVLGLPVRGSETNSNGESVNVWYSYYVVEPNVPTGYEVSYSNQSGESFNSISSGSITVTNKKIYIPPTTTSITVQKLWKDSDDQTELSTGLPDEIKVKLFRRAAGSSDEWIQYGEEIPLEKSQNWQKRIENLDVNYEYDIREVSVPGFRTESIAKVDNGFIITNVKNTTSITVQKNWASEYKTGDIPGDSVKFKLFRRLWDSAPTGEQMSSQPLFPEEYSSIQNVVTIDGNTVFTLSPNANGVWEKTFGNLPISEEIDGARKYYSYYIVEEPSSLYDISYGGVREATSGNLQVTNTLRPSYTLPNTGGVGTEIYTAAGLAVSIGAVLGLMKKRKKGERE